MKNLIVYSSILFAMAGSGQAATTLTATQAVTTSDLGSATTVGAYDDGVMAGAYHIRERRNTSQSNRQISSFFQFDVSSITLADTATLGFNVTFTIEYNSQLNNFTATNDASAIIGRVASSDGWDTSGTDYPLHDWGFDESGPTTIALDTQTLIASIPSLAPTGQEVTVDVTSIVTSWVDGTNDNYGLVLFINKLESQGAGFSNPELIASIPEPSSFALLALGLLPLVRRKR